MCVFYDYTLPPLQTHVHVHISPAEADQPSFPIPEY